MPKHFNIKIYGRVHGVGFRWSCQEKAEKLSLAGFARNEPDGIVYVEAEGEQSGIEKFINWCKKGPMWSSVKKVEVSEGEMKNFVEFTIEP